MREKVILLHGDLIEGTPITEKVGDVIYMPEENESPTLDGLTYGEKKTLIAFYSLGNEKLDGFSLYKIEDVWQAYFYWNGKRELACIAHTLFELCSQLVLSLGNEDISNRFILGMRQYVTEEEADSFIEGLKARQKDEGPKLNLIHQENNK